MPIKKEHVYESPRNNRASNDTEVEVILYKDFMSALMKLGLKRYVDIPEEAVKIEKLLETMGSLYQARVEGVPSKVIRLSTLLAAMRIFNYEYAGVSEAPKGIDFSKLDMKSIRILNRLTRLVVVYQDEFQKKAKDGVQVTISQIVGAIFKGHLEQTVIKT